MHMYEHKGGKEMVWLLTRSSRDAGQLGYMYTGGGGGGGGGGGNGGKGGGSGGGGDGGGGRPLNQSGL